MKSITTQRRRKNPRKERGDLAILCELYVKNISRENSRNHLRKSRVSFFPFNQTFIAPIFQLFSKSLTLAAQNRFILPIQDIYLIRHGETAYNRQKIVQGEGVDAPLNENGYQQALAFYQAYGDLPLDKIYTSRLKRAYQTIEPFFQQTSPPALEKHPGLNEINWGHFEGRAVAKEQKAYYHNLMESWLQGHTHIPIQGGESPEDVAAKQKPVVDKLLGNPEEKSVLICMHGRAMRIFLCHLLNKPLKAMNEFHHGNLGLYHIRVNDQNQPQLLKANCQGHLENRKVHV